MRVAYYSPMPPSRSGIADYSALLLPELEQRIEVVVAKPGRFRKDPPADVALYHVGNDAEAHGWIVDGAPEAAGQACRRPARLRPPPPRRRPDVLAR